MKKQLVRTSILIAIAIASLAQVANAGLIQRWNFENNFNDSVASYNLTPRGSPSFVPSQSSTGVAFDGGIVTAPAATPLDALDLSAAAAPNPTIFNSGFSITGWMRHHQSAQGAGPYSSGTIISQSGWSPAVNDRGWSLSMSSDGTLSMALRDSLDNRNYSVGIPSVLEDVWTHFAVTWDGSSADGFAYYLDGSVVGHTSGQVGTFGGFPNLPIGETLGATPLGAPNGAIEHGFVGALDDISVWTGALTAAEIQADYFAAVPEPSTTFFGTIGFLALARRRRSKNG